jgi:hypothetical protein
MGIKQQPLPQLATGHVKMTVYLGPHGTLVTSTKTKPVTMKSISETRVVNLCLQCRHVLVMGFYGARYFVGKFVMGVPTEAHYSVVSVCNEL